MELSGTEELSLQEYQTYRKAHGKVLHDNVHGEVCLGPLATQLRKTPAVQGLNHKHQLGCSHYVFPAAQHTRLAHSIGTAFLTVQQLDHLIKMGLAVNPRIIELLEVAGLSHDIGHGPFSHMFESIFLPAAGINGWKHEHMSAQVLEYTIDKHNIDMARDEVHFVQDIINGSRNSSLAGQEAWMFQIVANDLNSIDVDKIDYLLRDSAATGMKPVDFRGLLTNCKVVDDEICLRACHVVQDDLAGLYAGRASMHRKVYQHVDTVAAEFMVADAMIAAESELKISEDVHNPETFIHLDDRMLGEIQRKAARRTQNRDLQRAAALLQRLESGDLYPLVAEAVVPTEFVRAEGQDACKMTAADIVAHQDSNCMVQLVADDIRVQSMTIHHCKKVADPLDSVKLYDSSNTTRPASQGMNCRPAFFMDCQVRVYLARHRQDNVECTAYTKAVLAAVERAAKHRFGHNHPWLAVRCNESSCGGSIRFLQEREALAKARAANSAAAAGAAATAVAAPLEAKIPVQKANVVQEWSPQLAPRQLYPQQQQQQQERGIKRRPDGVEYVPASDDDEGEEEEGVTGTDRMETQPSQLSQLEPAPQRLRETVL